MTTLAERLGYGPDARLLIVNADDLGVCHAATAGVYEALRDGVASSASLMVPAPWARDAAAAYMGEDVGVHLTLNCEYDVYRWGPITHAPSLLDGDGGFPRTAPDTWEHADLDEVRRECRAQIERAILWGFDVSHLDSHLATMNLRAELFDVLLELAVEYRLPLRLFGASAETAIGFPARRLAAEEGIWCPDHVVVVPPGASARRTIEKVLFELRPGVTEVYVHPALDTPELRAMARDWANRVDEHHLVVHDAGLRAILARSDVTVIGYRDLRDAMRAA